MNDMSDWKETLKKDFGLKSKPENRNLLSNAISTFLHKHYNQFTEIQKKAIDPIYEGKDAILISSTASGKTEASLIPISARICEDRENTLCIYIAPTKALINDLFKRLETPLSHLGIDSAIRHGDKPINLKDPKISFLFTTPESLDILLYKNYSFLKKTKFIICDEIHLLFGSPRGMQLIFLINRLQNLVGKKIQRIALSATIGNKEDLKNWFKTQRVIKPEFRWIDKDFSLKDIIRESKSKKILIFANSRKLCDDIFLKLNNFTPYQVFIHYSNLVKTQREYVEDQFKKSEFAICIATSTLELGIDIGSIEKVILYDPPYTVSSFLQRIGRGSRRFQKSPVSMIPKNNLELLHFLALVDLAKKGLIEKTPNTFLYSVFIQQLFSIFSEKHNHKFHEKVLIELFKTFPELGPDDINLTCEILIQKGYLTYEDKWSTYGMGALLEKLHNRREIFTNILYIEPGKQIFFQNQCIAKLSLPLNYIKIGSVFLFAGRYWKVISLSEIKINVILCKPVSDPILPRYSSAFNIFSNHLLSNNIKKILGEKIQTDGLNIDKNTNYRIQNINRILIQKNYSNFILFYKINNKYVYYTFSGAIENMILQIVFLSNGNNIKSVKKTQNFAIESDEALDFSCLPSDEDNLHNIISSNWKKFRSYSIVGPFFDLLPVELSKKEIVSQILFNVDFSIIIRLRKATIINISENPF